MKRKRYPIDINTALLFDSCFKVVTEYQNGQWKIREELLIEDALIFFFQG